MINFVDNFLKNFEHQAGERIDERRIMLINSFVESQKFIYQPAVMQTIDSFFEAEQSIEKLLSYFNPFPITIVIVAGDTGVGAMNPGLDYF